MDVRDMTTKGTTTMFDRYRRIRRQIQDEQGEGNDDGFTLIELLIVIVVLGILAAVTVFGLSGVTGQSLTSACRADAKSVGVAQEAFRAQNPSQTPPFAASTGALVTAGYLRSDPGLDNAQPKPSANASHYIVSTDATTGAATVTDEHSKAQANFDVDPTICDKIT